MSPTYPSTRSEDADSCPEGSAPKARVALACQRCKRRKQRCDGVSPACKSCLKAEAICTYEVPMRVRYPGGKARYISALESRIALLEASMPEYSGDHLEAAKGPIRPSKSPLRETAGLGAHGYDKDTSTVVDGVAFLSLSASGATDVATEPHYVGSSSGVTIARMLEASIFDHASVSGRPESTDEQLLPSIPAGESARTAPLDLPTEDVAATLLAMFFDKLHTRWPLLDRKLYEDLYQQYWHRGATLDPLHQSMFHLIFAISARFHQLTRRSSAVDSDTHFKIAILAMNNVLEQHNLFTVQFICLLAVHGQRSPFGAGSWSQIRYAVTLAIDLGLHRKEAKGTGNRTSRETELRRRVFWSCYCLDRMTSITLGRSFAIGDRDINVEIPSQIPDTFDLTEVAASRPSEHSWTNILPFIHITKLCRIQSEIHRLVLRVDKDILSLSGQEHTRLETKLTFVGQELDAWAENVPKAPTNGEKVTWMYDNEASYHDCSGYFNLQYHKTLLMLFTALLPGFEQGDSRIRAGALSAVATCMAYKRFHQHKVLSYTTIALHSSLVAGLTLIYCLSHDKTLFDFKALEATHACTQALTIFAEKWPGAAKYRDVYDGLSGRVLSGLINQQWRDDAPNHPGESRPQAVGFEREAFDEVHQDAPGGWQVGAMLDELAEAGITGDVYGSSADAMSTTGYAFDGQYPLPTDVMPGQAFGDQSFVNLQGAEEW